MSKKVAILQSNYIPWKGYFDLINSVDEFIIYDDVQYTKNDWRNRNKIKTPQGLQWITIPVIQEKLDQKIKDTKIFSSSWNVKNWKTLQQNYAKAPFFKSYKDIFENLYLTNTSLFLSEINYNFIVTINKILNIETKLTWSSKFKYEGDKSDRLIQLIKLVGGKEYISGPAAKDYLDESLFKEEGIKVSWADYSGYPEYEQLYPPFAHNVTILDLIFNTGPEATDYMKSFRK